jgi:hypothetical protein
LQALAPKVLSETAKKTLEDLLSQSFDIFNTYGKDPEALKSIYHGFETVLAGYSERQILSAFREWLDEHDTMPTPAAIKKIINWEPLPKSHETRMFEREVEQQRVRAEKYHQLPPEKQKEHDELMAALRQRHENPKLARGPGKLDYKHWKSTPEEVQKAIMADMPNSLKRLRASQGVPQ